MAQKAFDVSKFRKNLTKAVPGMSSGFNDPRDWISTGNHTLNYLMTGDFQRGVPLGKVTMFAGESGSGKSYICSGNLVRNAQQVGILPVILDSENALDEDWLKALGIDTAPDKLMRFGVSMIDEVAKFISEFMREYKDAYGDLPYEEQQKVLFVVDSVGMLLTPTDINQFEAGDMKGDMGRKAKALTALIKNTVNRIAPHPVGLVVTNHTYASQDMFDPDDKITGGQGFVYASSMVVAMKKMKLKEDEDGNKTTTVQGIRAGCKIMKTRYSKPFESVQVKIPYNSGMDPYSGLVELFEARGWLKKEGNKLVYTTMDGEVIKEFRKGYTDEILDRIMADVVARGTDMAYQGAISPNGEEDAVGVEE
jgi:recombination protein RecA